MDPYRFIRRFDTLGVKDVPIVGGKNASLGEMTRELTSRGIRVPNGFATTADAYRALLKENDLTPVIERLLGAMAAGSKTLQETGEEIRRLIREAHIPAELGDEIRAAYRELSHAHGVGETDVAVRSSATAEDLPHASFAGQQESFLNVRGEQALLEACRRCFASLFTDRAIVYREAHGFDHLSVALSIGIQQMVRADRGSAGVMFTLDTESGFPGVVLINAAWGLGENVVKGTITPDQYMIFKALLDVPGKAPIIEKKIGTKAVKMVYAPSLNDHGVATVNVETSAAERAACVLSDEDMLTLARWAVDIEWHYGMPMDIEWARDGRDGLLYIVQARPETVQSRAGATSFKSYRLVDAGRKLATGLSVGNAIATGPVRCVTSIHELDDVEPGAILVARMTDPDWVPAMRRVAAVVTDVGGRTCHAAIVSRELGIPAVVGTGNATSVLHTGQIVTVSCGGGEEGHVYDGALEFEVDDIDISGLPHTDTKIMLNLAAPDAAFQWWRLPADGIGLARMEFIVSQWIKVHPMALVHYNRIEDPLTRRQIDELTRGYADKTEYFVDRLAQGIAKLAAAAHPHPVIVRTSDFKTNEYAHLIGGDAFEPHEENPMIGWRGASRYYDPGYREGFELECRALRRVRDAMGFTNVAVMIPFCRTVGEADRVLEVMAACGLTRGKDALEVYMMCEIPSNVILVDRFSERFDAFSIGSNDLTQLVLGIDRDSGRLAFLFDERDEAVLRMIRTEIQGAHAAGRRVGICGQAPSDYPDFVDFLVDVGIDSMSLNPDSFIEVKRRVAEAEIRRDMDILRSPVPA